MSLLTRIVIHLAIATVTHIAVQYIAKGVENRWKLYTLNREAPEDTHSSKTSETNGS